MGALRGDDARQQPCLAWLAFNGLHARRHLHNEKNIVSFVCRSGTAVCIKRDDV